LTFGPSWSGSWRFRRVEPGFNGVEFHYVATITKPEALEMTRRLEAEIDDLQDRLNTYNASTRIELPRAVLDLAR
jgi:hypothetical protein